MVAEATIEAAGAVVAVGSAVAVEVVEASEAAVAVEVAMTKGLPSTSKKLVRSPTSVAIRS